MPLVNVTTQNAIKSWSAISWRDQHQRVNNLRQRIYRATEMGDIKRVRNLQKLMLKSTANKLTAIRRVTQQNQGRNSPGIDKVIVQTHKERKALYQKLNQARPGTSLAVKRVYIPKKQGKRPLGLPTIFDRATQALHLMALEPVVETRADRHAYGFRPKRSCADAIEQCFIALAKQTAPTWILEGDIKSCFDTIGFSWLLKETPMDKKILKQWLNAGYMENKTLHVTEEGTPQGGLCKALHKPPYAKKNIMQSKHLLS